MSNHYLKIADRWLTAFNEHHIENLLSLYADDAVHYSPKLMMRHPDTKGQIQGKANLRTWWKEAFDRLPTLRYRATSLTSNDDRVFMEYVRMVDGEQNRMIAEVLEIKNGLIVASRVYHG